MENLRVPLSEISTGRFIGRVFAVHQSTLDIRLGSIEQSGGYQTMEGDCVVVISSDYLYVGDLSFLQSTGSDASSARMLVRLAISRQDGLVHYEQFPGRPAEKDSVYLAPVELKGLADQAAQWRARMPQPNGGKGKIVSSEQINMNNNASHPRVEIALAQLTHEPHSNVIVTPESFFGRHMAVLGATGGGKSWTIARIVEECARYHSKIILFDASGEYTDLRAGTRHVFLGENRKAKEHEHEVAVPYYHLTETDLFAIFQPSGESQAPKLRAAMKSLKLAQHAKSLAPDGTIFKAHKSRTQFDEEYRRYRKKIDTPLADFEIRDLPRQIEHECVDPQRSATEPHIWGGINGRDLAQCTPLINRIQDVITLPTLAPIFQPKKIPSLFREIHKFFDDPELRVLRISLEYFPFTHNAREILVNALGRHLLDLGRVGMYDKKPVLAIVDEAHQFLSIEKDSNGEPSALNAYSLIAREGRKFGLNLCLATQRPRDIPEAVLSQMGTFIIHRISNDSDRRVIERACGEVDKLQRANVPGLAPGQALLLGVDFPDPLPISIITPSCRPQSHGPNFQECW